MGPRLVSSQSPRSQPKATQCICHEPLGRGVYAYDGRLLGGVVVGGNLDFRAVRPKAGLKRSRGLRFGCGQPRVQSRRHGAWKELTA